jgi:hypothetical protein
MLQWNYKSQEKSSNGYEDVMDILKSHTKKKYISLSKGEQEIIIDKIFKIYRSKNIYPITYYNEDGIINEINKVVNKEINWENNILDFKFSQGQSLCRFLFPNLLAVDVRGHKNNSLYDRFFDDNKLKRAVDFSLKYRKTASPAEIRASLEMIEHGIPTNFKPINAKLLFERYCPKNGIIYDYACGFGGRMLGALTSKNNYKYLGIEPNMETYTHLNELGLYIERATNRQKSYKLFCMGSEDFMIKENYIDFAFSSPPYFNLEQYCDEPTQCYIKFPELEKWFDGYVKPTINNIYKMLKPNAYYAVNIADFKIGRRNVEYVNEWIRISKEVGFKYIEEINLQLKSRGGDGREGNNNQGRKEGIFVFKK